MKDTFRSLLSKFRRSPEPKSLDGQPGRAWPSVAAEVEGEEEVTGKIRGLKRAPAFGLFAMDWSAEQFEAARFGLVAAMGAIVIASIGTELTWRTLSQESRAFIEQSIGDTASLLASHVKLAISNRVEKGRAFGYGVETASEVPPSGKIERDLDTDILALSAWKREDTGWTRRWIAAPSLRLKDFEAFQTTERARLEQVFIGGAITGQSPHVVFQPSGSDGRGYVWIAIPEPALGRVWTIFTLTQGLDQVFKKEHMVRGLLVDAYGQRIAGGGDTPNEFQPILDTLLKSEVRTPSQQLKFEGVDGRVAYGGFRKVGVGGLAVLTRVAEADVRSGLDFFKVRSALFIVMIFVGTFLGGYAYSRSRARKRPERAAPEALATAIPGPGPTPTWNRLKETFAPAERISVVALFGRVRGVSGWINDRDPELMRDTMVDFMTLAESRAEEFKGLFDCGQGHEFYITFSGENAHIFALSLAIQFRKDLNVLNESRKVDGLPEVHFGFGVHVEGAIHGKFGPASRLKENNVTHAAEGARVLEAIAERSGMDGVISLDALNPVGTQFIGERVGEARLGVESGLVEYMYLAGYLGEQGEEIRVETPYSRREPVSGAAGGMVEVSGGHADGVATGGAPYRTRRWLVSNGSTMMGPFDASAIGALLFAQEIDFDSECWAEGTGESATIGQCGLFGVTTDKADEGSHYWVYDGSAIHGPLTRGLVLTALTRGALPEQSFVCERSTVEGWRAASEWIEANRGPSAETPAPVASDEAA